MHFLCPCRAIQSAELVDASWTKDDKKENSSPNLLRMSRFETKVYYDIGMSPSYKSVLLY